MTRRLYVYYRVEAAALEAAIAAARRLQQAMRDAHPGLQAELLRRPEWHDGQATLMETYAAPGGVSAALQAAIDAAAKAEPTLPAERHIEVFETVA